MRILFLITLAVSIILGYLNGFFIPAREDSSRKKLDSSVRQLPVGNVNARQYTVLINLRPLDCRIENLKIEAEDAKWDVAFKNISLKVEHIRFDPYALLLKKQKKVISIGNVEFKGKTTFAELARKLAWINTDLKEISMWFDGGHVFLSGNFEPLKGKVEFDGSLIISPAGDLKYIVRTAKNQEGEIIRSRQVLSLIEEKTDFVLITKILNRTIKLDDLEVDETGVKLTGKT